MFASEIQRQRASRMRGSGRWRWRWRWRLDEVLVKINGKRYYLWRAVDYEGEVLEGNVTKKRDKAAALAFLKKALKRHGRAEAIATEGLRSYPAALRQLGNLARRKTGRRLNNRAENWHLPFRRRERAMLRFRRMKSLQKFASAHAGLHNHFNSERHSRRSLNLQAATLGRLGRVAVARRLKLVRGGWSDSTLQLPPGHSSSRMAYPNGTASSPSRLTVSITSRTSSIRAPYASAFLMWISVPGSKR